MPCQQAQHAKLYSDVLQASKEGTFDNPGLHGGSQFLRPWYPTPGFKATELVTPATGNEMTSLSLLWQQSASLYNVNRAYTKSSRA